MYNDLWCSRTSEDKYFQFLDYMENLHVEIVYIFCFVLLWGEGVYVINFEKILYATLLLLTTCKML